MPYVTTKWRTKSKSWTPPSMPEHSHRHKQQIKVLCRRDRKPPSVLCRYILCKWSNEPGGHRFRDAITTYDGKNPTVSLKPSPCSAFPGVQLWPDLSGDLPVHRVHQTLPVPERKAEHKMSHTGIKYVSGQEHPCTTYFDDCKKKKDLQKWRHIGGTLVRATYGLSCLRENCSCSDALEPVITFLLKNVHSLIFS